MLCPWFSTMQHRAHTHTHTYTHTHTQTHTHTYRHTHTYTYTHTYKRTHRHTHTHRHYRHRGPPASSSPAMGATSKPTPHTHTPGSRNMGCSVRKHLRV